MRETGMQETDLKTALSECQKAAKTGYKIASAQEKVLSRTLSDAQEKVQKTIDEFNRSQVYAPETTRLLEEQLSNIKSDFNRLSFAFKEDLADLHEDLSKFSITLFGRTTAGKSTLMEILREGNGSSIGKGGQRTTRDVRHYLWNGLVITDVPGIAAFEGNEDETIAFEATKGADLVIFLLNESPQYKEALWFSKVLSLGKPIICVVNVKVSISEEDDIAFIEWDVNESFDTTELRDIHKQFLEYSKQFGQTWNHIPFVYVHLQSAFLSQHIADNDVSERLYSLSRIDSLKKKIIEQVVAKGKYYRLKTFIDVISIPLLESMSSLLEQSQDNSLQGRTVLAKKRQLLDWKNQFYAEGISQIEALFVRIKSDLKSEMAGFVEDHFDDKHASEAWDEVKKAKRIDDRCQAALKQLELDCNDKLLEVSREIANELEYTVTASRRYDLNAKPLVDGKRIVEWSTIAVGGTLSIATAIAVFMGVAIAGPLGAATTAVAVGGAALSLFLKSKNHKEDIARKKMAEQLTRCIDKECASLQAQMKKHLEQIIAFRIDPVLKEMDALNTMVFSLADTQQSLAWNLNERLLVLNRKIVEEAINLLGYEELNALFTSVARIPGNTSLLLLRDGVHFPEEKRKQLYEFMSERINFTYDSTSKKTLISRVLGKSIDRSQISIERKINVAHVPMEELTPTMWNRIQLAEQLSGLSIMR